MWHFAISPLPRLSAGPLHICACVALAVLSTAVPCWGQTVSANPNKLTFSYTPGGTIPPNQTVSLSTAGAAVT